MSEPNPTTTTLWTAGDIENSHPVILSGKHQGSTFYLNKYKTQLHEAVLNDDSATIQSIYQDHVEEMQRLQEAEVAQNSRTHVPHMNLEPEPLHELKYDSGDSLLHVACEKGHLQVVLTLVTINPLCPFNTKVTNHKFETALHLACEHDHLPIVKFLLENKISDMNAKNAFRRTPFHVACMQGRLEIVKYLVKSCHDHPLNIDDVRDKFGVTPFHAACMSGNLQVVQLLAPEFHVRVDTADYDGMTAFMIACARGHLPIVKVLNLDLDCRVHTTDVDGSTPFYHACQSGHLNIVQYLMEHKLVDVNYRNCSGTSPFQVACRRGHEEVVQAMLACDKVRVNELMIDRNLGVPECPLGYIPAMGKPMVYYDYSSHPLFEACHRGDLQLVKCLLAHPRMRLPHWKSSKNKTKSQILPANYNSSGCPLFQALLMRNTEIFQLLLQDGRFPVSALCTGNVGMVDGHKGRTLLHVACYYGYEDIIALLVRDPRMDVNRKDTRAFTALHYAARTCDIPAVRLLFTCAHQIVKSSSSITDYIQPAGLTYYPDHPELEHLLVHYNIDPKGFSIQLRRELGISSARAATTFVLVVLLCDGYLSLITREQPTSTTVPAPVVIIDTDTAIEERVRFLTMIQKLPMELQMKLCNCVNDLNKDTILTKDTEPEFKRLLTSASAASTTTTTMKK